MKSRSRKRCRPCVARAVLRGLCRSVAGPRSGLRGADRKNRSNPACPPTKSLSGFGPESGRPPDSRRGWSRPVRSASNRRDYFEITDSKGTRSGPRPALELLVKMSSGSGSCGYQVSRCPSLARRAESERNSSDKVSLLQPKDRRLDVYQSCY